jgi:flagellar motor switch protein FliG
MRKMVEAELSGGAVPPEDEIQAAQQEIAATALELARNGEITLPADE